MLNPGTELQNRYKIEAQIGAGGMGTVYTAIDLRFKTRVAIKETHFSDANMRRAFEHEAQLLNGLRHPVLPRVSDHFCEGDGQFIVMEYIAGKDLSQISADEFEIADVLRWADALLDALDYLHTQKKPILHRDIKPQNLKLTERGDVILLDFGLAKGSIAEQTQASVAESVFGYSISFSPLEQIQAVGTDPRTDLYSLAATIFQLLTRQNPIDCISRATAIVKGGADPLLPVHRLNSAIPLAVSNLIFKAMSLNPSLRPASAAEMRQALARAVAQNVLPVKKSETIADDRTIAIEHDSAKSARQNFAPVNFSANAAANRSKTATAETVASGQRQSQIGNSANQTDYTTRLRKPQNSLDKQIAARRFAPSGRASNKNLFYNLQNSRSYQLGAALTVVLLGVACGIFAWHSMNPANDAPARTAAAIAPDNAIIPADSGASNNALSVAATPAVFRPETLSSSELAPPNQSPIVAAPPPTNLPAAPTEHVAAVSASPASEPKIGESAAQPPTATTAATTTRPNDSSNQLDADSMKAEMKKQLNEALRQREESMNRQRGEQPPPPFQQPPPPDGRGFPPPNNQPPPPRRP